MRAINHISRNNDDSSFDYHIFKQVNVITDSTKLDIMIIDDNKKDIDLFEELLSTETKLQFSLSKWTNPMQAVYDLEKKNIVPNLIFLDLIMPGVNGAMVLKRLKASIFAKSIPIIIHSSMNNYENIKKVFSLDQAIAFFAKPLNAPALEAFLVNGF